MKYGMLKKEVKIGLIVVLAVIDIAGACYCGTLFRQSSAEPVHPFAVAEKKEETDERMVELNEARRLNSDVVGIFELGNLIREVVVQADDHSKYMDRDWRNMEKRSCGSVFMDYRNSSDGTDRNTILYGHYVYEKASRDRSLMFTPLARYRREPLETLPDQAVFYTASFTYRYELIAVFDCPLEDAAGLGKVAPDHLQYNLPDYEESYFPVYRKAVGACARVTEAFSRWDETSDLLTLQTCVEGDPDLRQIVVFRQISCQNNQEPI